MAEHTPEPWDAIDGRILASRDCRPVTVADMRYKNGDADARRAAACVNFCKGSTTEAIEEFTRQGHTLPEVMRALLDLGSMADEIQKTKPLLESALRELEER